MKEAPHQSLDRSLVPPRLSSVLSEKGRHKHSSDTRWDDEDRRRTKHAQLTPKSVSFGTDECDSSARASTIEGTTSAMVRAPRSLMFISNSSYVEIGKSEQSRQARQS